MTTYYRVEYTADTEGDWCQACVGRAFASREAAEAAIESDPTAGPDDFGNRCYPTVVEFDAEEAPPELDLSYVGATQRQGAPTT